VSTRPKVLIIRMRSVPAIDATGLHALSDVVRRSRSDGTLVLLAEVQPQPRQALQRSVLIDVIGEENLYATLDEALERGREELAARSLLGITTGKHQAVS